MIRVTSNNLGTAIAKLSNANPGKLRRALQSAVMRTLRGAKKDAGTKIKQRYTIAAGHVTKTIRLNSSGLTGEMTSTGGRNKLSLFHLRPKSRPRRMPAGGVFVMNVRGQGGNIRRGFLQRNGEPYERVGTSRFPIKRFTGPSAPGMLSSPPVSSFIVAKMSTRLQINVEHELSAAIGGFL